ncbi:hypothetical protein CY35_13G026500 [Sphagnum magellanicum]|jgi:hypothetical protein|nr:hypothetical protein CY35_13G026500 [Sphagnum magellanicum]
MPRRHPSHSMAPCSVQVVVLEKLEYGACSRFDEGHEIEACDQGRTFGCRRRMLSRLSMAEVPAAGRRFSTSGDGNTIIMSSLVIELDNQLLGLKILQTWKKVWPVQFGQYVCWIRNT